MSELTVPSFAEARVLVAGDVMLDRYWHGDTGRVSPEAPVPVVRVCDTENRPGGAANVALNVAALGTDAGLVGVVGADEAAGALRTQLESTGISCHFQTAPEQPTITKLRVISRHQQLLRLDFEEPFDELEAAPFARLVSEGLQGAGALVLSDYQKGALRDPRALIQQAREKGVPVLVDPKGTDFERYSGASVLTPNLAEFEAVVGPVSSEQELVDKGQVLMDELDIGALLITRSEDGMTLLRAGRPELHFPARAHEVYDVTGAGDTVIAVLATVVATGGGLDDAVALANLAAGLVVAKLGTAVVSAPELRRAVSSQGGAGRGSMSEEQLLIAVEDARAHGERIVFTNGCFDLLHAGHVGYLASARQQGDRLVVAVNSDDSVRRMKGAGRPVNPLERRMAVLAALEVVDWVVSFDEDTPEALLERIRPEVLVKGGDYSADEVVGAPIVRGYGGEVKVLDFIGDLSSTRIIERLQN